MFMQQPLKIIFAGTPEISQIVLKKILADGFKIDLVLTRADSPAGRGKKISISPVKETALEHNIEVFQPLSFKKNPEAINKLQELESDIMIVVAYGLILPEEVLSIPRLGCVNIHVSLLPHLRGAAPIQRAILAGDVQSGVTIMQMDKGLDTGPILMQESILVDKYETSGSLHDKLAILGADMIIHYLKNYASITPINQHDAYSSYAPKIEKSEALIDYNEDASLIWRKTRGFNPFPGSFTFLGKQRVLIWEAEVANEVTNLACGTIISSSSDGILVACGNNSVLKIKQLQLAGRKRQNAGDFVVGYGDLAGKIFSSSIDE